MSEINEKLKKKKFWESYLNKSNEISKIPFWSDLITITKSESAKSKLNFRIENSLLEKIESLTKGSNYLNYVFLSAVVQTTIFKYTNSSQALIGTPALQKSDIESSNHRILPLVTELGNIITFKDLLNSVKKDLTSIYKNQEFPLEHLTSKLDVDVIQSLLDFTIRFEGLHESIQNSSYIDISFTKDQGTLGGWIYYPKDSYAQEAIEEFKDNFISILSQVLENLDINLKETCLQSEIHAQKQNTLHQETENQVLHSKMLEHNSVLDVKILNENEKITAYVIGAPNKFRSTHMLMKFLKDALSDDFLPDEIQWVEALPEKPSESNDTPSKIKSVKNTSSFTQAEKKVQTVWSEVLSLDMDAIGLEDDFFDIGGDSISSMQVYFKLKELGFGLSPQDMIATPFIKDIAEKFDVPVALNADQHSVSGKVKLAPSQEWFFEKEMNNVHYFNNFVSVEFRKNFRSSTVKSVITALIKHHDILRTKFMQNNGVWEQYIEEIPSENTFAYYDVSELSESEQILTINSVFEKSHKEIHITQGPLIKFIHISRGKEPDYLSIIGHRLITDGVTLDILLEDLFRGMEQLDNDEELVLPLKSTSFMFWSNSLDTYITTEQFKRNSIYWNNKKATSSSMLFKNIMSQNDAFEKNTKILIESLDEKSTTELEKIASYHLKTGMREIVFSTFLKTMNQWTNSQDVLIETGGHGRETITKDVDLTRTAGWFTTNYPVLLSMPNSSNNIISVIEEVKNQLNEIPLNGFDYGILRYRLNQKNGIFGLNPLIGLDYQGRFRNADLDSKPYTIINVSSVSERDLENQRMFLFDISSWIEDGRFTLRWSFDEHQFEETTIKNLMKNFLVNLQTITETHKNFSI